MRRYISGIIAIVIATGAVAFTKHENKVRPYSSSFYFTGNPLTPGDVADESQWSLTPPAGTECGGTQNKACMIVVDDDQTEVVDGKTVLKSSLNITAVAGAGGTGSGYVPQFPHTGISARDSRP